MLEVLLEAGAAVDVQNGVKDTALSLARVQEMEAETQLLERHTKRRASWTEEHREWWVSAHLGFLRWYITSGVIDDLTTDELVREFPEIPAGDAAHVLRMLQKIRDYEVHRRHLLENPEAAKPNPYYDGPEGHTLTDPPEVLMALRDEL